MLVLGVGPALLAVRAEPVRADEKSDADKIKEAENVVRALEARTRFAVQRGSGYNGRRKTGRQIDVSGKGN
jgi:hypothetical protein